MKPIEPTSSEFRIRHAEACDTKLILQFIKDLAAYEKLLHEVSATEELLHEWLFVKEKAEILFGEVDGEPVAMMLFFHNFSTFLGKAGIYLEDLFVKPAFRGRGYGKTMLKHLAKIAVERNCGRLEWVCLDWNTPSIEFYESLGAKQMNDWIIFRTSGEELEALAK